MIFILFRENLMTKSIKLKNVLVSEEVAYKNPHEHLREEIYWLNRKLAAYVIKVRTESFLEDTSDLKGFFISDNEIDSFLGIGNYGNQNDGRKTQEQQHVDEINKLIDEANNLRIRIDKRIQKSLEKSIGLPLLLLTKHFNLTAFEVQALIICIAPIVDSRYAKAYAYLNNDFSKKYPTRELIFSLLGEGRNPEYGSLFKLHHPSSLIRYGLIEIGGDELYSSSQYAPLKVDSRIAQYILSHQAIDEKLSSTIKYIPPIPWDQVVIPNDLFQSLNGLLNYELSKNGRVCLYLQGRQGVGRKTVARALCGDQGISMLLVDVRELLHTPEEFEGAIKRLLREGMLQLAAVCFCNIESLEIYAAVHHAGIVESFVEAIEELGWLVFLCSDQPIPQAMVKSTIIYPFEISPPQLEDQLSLWKLHLKKLKIDSNPIDLDKVISRFNLTGGQICSAVQRASKSAHIRNPQHSTINTQDLIVSSRIQSQPNLSRLARKVSPKYCWGDLVLPEGQSSQLRDIINQVKHRHTVMNLWGFNRKLSLGRGLNALFFGPSGTGKTMAAEVIGHELALDLYKIDLSAVVSKYIGETEKNLNRLFDEAEHSNAILFFDEADALLGKRSEVKDAHDRFANIEVAYLLQKMEEYEGITILSTNLRQNIDDAFIRRIQYIVDFPFPSPLQRELIWGKVFPDNAPINNELDFSFLANRFKLTGGNIGNIAIRASYYAAEQGNKINMMHVVRATKRELQKAGSLFTEADFDKYAEAVKEL